MKNIHTLWMNPREGTVPLINFPGQDTCAVCSSGYRVTADGKCENANMLYWCLALGFFPPESWRLGDSQDVFFFLTKKNGYLSTHMLNADGTSCLEMRQLRGGKQAYGDFKGKLATKKKIVPTQNWDVAGLPDL